MRSGHHFEVLHCNWNDAIGPKMRFGHNLSLEGPIDLRPTRLNCILHDLFRDTPLHKSAVYTSESLKKEKIFALFWLDSQTVAYAFTLKTWVSYWKSKQFLIFRFPISPSPPPTPLSGKCIYVNVAAHSSHVVWRLNGADYDKCPPR